MGTLEITGKRATEPQPLRGLPLRQGRHTRFTDSESADPIDSPKRPMLRGLPPATGSHLRFDD